MHKIRELLWEFFKENKGMFLVASVFLCIVPIHDIVLPLLYSQVVNAINNGTSFIIPLIIVTSVLVLLQVLDFMNDFNDTRLFPKLQTFIRSRTMMSLLDKYEDAIEDLEIGEINTKMVKLPSVITSFFERCKNFLIPHMLLHLSAICLFFYVDKYLGLTMLVTVVILYSVLMQGPKKCDVTTVKRDQAFNKLHEEIDDSLRNLYSIYGTNQKENEVKRLEKFNEIYNSYFRKTTLCSFGLRAMISPVVIAFIIILMARIHQMVQHKLVDMSLFVPVFFITLYVINSFMALDDQLKNIIVEWGIIKSSMDLLDSKGSKGSKGSKDSIENYTDKETDRLGVGLVDATFQYPNSNNKILNGVTLHINHGESVAILGDIGSGKSTILKLLLNYFKPTSGTVYYNNVPYDHLPIQVIRKHIGYVPQVPVLFNRSILDNILYGNTKSTRAEVETVLDEMGLLKEFKKLNNGLDTKIGKNGSVLSGGQRQLVWCLRVMMSNPDVLIMDEPTSSIDEKSKAMLRLLLDKFMKGKTVIMVTHDPAIVSFSKKFVHVKDGKIEKITERNSFY
jgi:ABC-type multidrug transport system fused ATPase/permease subunit